MSKSRAMPKIIRIFQIIILTACLVLYIFPSSFEFDARGWGDFLLGLLCGTLIVSILHEISQRKARKMNPKPKP